MPKSTLELHRRAETALQSLSPRTAKKVKKTFELIAENADNLFNFPGKVFQFAGKFLPANTYMVEATPTLRVIFELDADRHVLIQHIMHRDWFAI
jgi:hypothetical protein